MPKDKDTPREAACSPTPKRDTKASLGAHLDRHNRRIIRITGVQGDPGNMRYIDQDGHHLTNTYWDNGSRGSKDLQGSCLEQTWNPEESDQRQGTPVCLTVYEGLV